MEDNIRMNLRKIQRCGLDASGSR